jgi:hypothetical protein
MPPIPLFCNGTYQAISPVIDAEYAMNFFCERSESPGARTPMALIFAPGKKLFTQVPEAGVSSMLPINGRGFIAGSQLYEVLANGQSIVRGSLGGTQPQNPCQIFANETQLLCLNNGNLYVFTFLGAITAANVTAGHGGANYAIGDTGSVVGSGGGSGATYTVTAIGVGGAVTAFTITPGSKYTAVGGNATSILTGNGDGTLEIDVTAVADNNLYPVNMAQLQGGAGSVTQIGFADGYFFSWFKNSHSFQMSSLEDGTTWSGLDVATVSLFPDNFVSMICDHREAWFFSGKKSAGYYNAGAGFPPFIPIQGAYAEFGSGATWATVQADNTVCWIGADERGTGIAYRLNGYGNQRISTHAVEFAWQRYARIDDARAYTYQENGHAFWVIYFPTANATWVYDFSTQLWHQRGAWNQISGKYDADHSQSHMEIFGIHLVGDWASGNVYQQSTAIYTDNGGPIRAERDSPTANKDNKWLYFEEIEIDIEPGIGPQPPLLDGAGRPRAPQIMLSWSNDGGKTWSATFLLNCGLAGEYNARARKTMLGRGRKRIWKIVVSDPIPWRIANAYVQATASKEAA